MHVIYEFDQLQDGIRLLMVLLLRARGIQQEITTIATVAQQDNNRESISKLQD